MSSNKTSWFHCGRCGTLFLSPAGESDERFCTTCGCNPSLGIDMPPPDPAAAAETAESAATDPHDHAGGRKKTSSRKRKQSYLMVKLAFCWMAVLAAIVLAARHFWEDRSEERANIRSTRPAEHVVSAEDTALQNEASPLCNQALAGFLTASTPEERNQFVSSPIETASRMARFYSQNPMASIDPATLGTRNAAVIDLPGGKAIELQLGSSDGRLLDVVFVRENEEWKIDWDHYARYSDSPWALFLAGSGDAEGEFRLLARERLADERKDRDTLSLVLYAPRFGFAKDTGFQSPEFIVKRDTPNGRLLESAFKLEREGARAFGVNLPSLNPEGFIRIRVKIRRSEVDQKRHFEIGKVIACHWYSTDEPGMETSDPPRER